MSEQSSRVEVSRNIPAPASKIFEILSSPNRHADFDGSDMLRGTDERCVVVAVGDSFEMKMNRMGRDYCMINYVVEFERDRKIFWEPSPGDVDTAGGDPSKIGVPSGYCWGFELRSESDVVTVVTHIFQCGSDENSWILQNEGGKWINGRNSVVESMEASLLKLEAICTN